MPNLDVLDFNRVPRNLPHRGPELQTIKRALEPIRDGDSGRPVRIHGPSGAGKTSVATEAARKAKRQWGVPYVKVDCMSTRTRASTLHELAGGLGCVKPLDGTPPKVFHDFIRDEVDQAVAIVDEAGRLDDLDVIQELVEHSSLTVIVVCHDESELLARAGSRVSSRLRGGPTVHCRQYTTSELIDILKARVRAGSLTHWVSDDLLQTVASAGGGNARDAIAILARVIEHAHQEGIEATSDLVGEIEPEARKQIVKRNLSKMDAKHQAIYELIHDAGELRADELKERADENLHVTDPERRRILEALQGSYQVIESEGSSRWKTYRPLYDVSVDSARVR